MALIIQHKEASCQLLPWARRPSGRGNFDVWCYKQTGHVWTHFFCLHLHAQPQTANSSPAPHSSLLHVLKEGFCEMFGAVPFAEPPILGPSRIKTLPAAGNLEILLNSCPWFWQLLPRYRQTGHDSNDPAILSGPASNNCLTLPVGFSPVLCLNTSSFCSHGMTPDCLVGEDVSAGFF